MAKTFLQAEWRKLAMANYSVDQSLLERYLPRNTEIDLWNDVCYVSLVGFLFKDTRIRGFSVPFHRNFEEVNLRFYVRYKDNGTWKRGVVFIKEFVPKRALTFVANMIYKEKYTTLPMSHSWTACEESLAVEYRWKRGQWHSFKVIAEPKPLPILNDSEEEFITEHYWGYTRINDTQTSEYGVEHPRWDVYAMKDYTIDVDFGRLYGDAFSFLQTEKPRSVFLAEGSAIKVMSGRRV